MNPMRTTKLIVGELIVDSRKTWRATGFAAAAAILSLTLAGGFAVAAQEPDPGAQATQTNDTAAAEVLARLSQMVQGDDSGLPEDITAPEDETATNGTPPVGALAPTDSHLSSSNRFANPNRGQNDDRRSRRRSIRSRSSQSGGLGSASNYRQGGDGSQTYAATGTNGSLARLDYSAFRIIVERNIFDPNRYPRQAGGPRPAPKTVDSLTLVGTMTYEKGTFAFFDGTSSDYKKALKLNDVIAGYRVTNIAPNGVQLAAGTNALDLGVGMQLRREENGPWMLSGQSGSYTATTTSTSTNSVASTGPDAASSGAESDVIKRLMQRRGQE